MNFKKSQSGRSMVEMLGVLAIIGVLSVGGIAGYSLSMRRHRANQVVDAVSKYALIVYGTCFKLVEEGFSDWGDIVNCERAEGIPAFEYTGIGPKPSGVEAISFDRIDPNPRNDLNDPNDNGDTMFMNVVFSDKKLCQAVASITGTTCSTDNRIWGIKINQN